MKTKLKDAQKVIGEGPLEPILNSRFVVEFEENLNIGSFTVRSVTKPVYQIGYWGDIRIEFTDFISPSTSRTLYNLIHPEPKDNFTFHIKLLDPIGKVIETWKIEVNRIKTIDFRGKIEYLPLDKDEASIITMIIEPENCILL